MNFIFTPVSDESEIQIIKTRKNLPKIINIKDIHKKRYIDGVDQNYVKKIAESVRVPLYRRRNRIKKDDTFRKTPAERAREYRARDKAKRLQELLKKNNNNKQSTTDTTDKSSSNKINSTIKVDQLTDPSKVQYNNIDKVSKKTINNIDNSDNENYNKISINKVEKKPVFIQCGSLVSPDENNNSHSILPDINESTFKNTSNNKKINKSIINNNYATVLSNEIKSVPVAIIINNIHQINY